MTDACPPDVAVIVPTKNRRRVLPQAVESVLAQTHASFELIVVDDCSEDDTAAYLASISDPRLRWHRFDEWQGGNAARNHGVRFSRAPILSFLDSDDRYRPERLADTVAFFAQHPEVDIRISSYTSVAGPRVVHLANPEANLTCEELERYLVGYCLYLGGSGMTVRRRAFDEIGGFDATLERMQDRDFLLRAARTRGCASTANIDWIKVRSRDSVSREREGRVAGLGELFRRHPIIRDRYTVLFRYMVAREIVTSFLQGHVRIAANAIQEARRNPHVGLSLESLVLDYVRGKRLRRDLKQEIVRRYGATMR